MNQTRQAVAMLAPCFGGELKTPAALVDVDKLEANTARMSERMRHLGVKLRPHVKTHKCIEAARFQVRGHFGGITVSTLAEARFFGRAGFRDITDAVPIAPARLEEAHKLAATLDELHLLVGNEATLAEMEACARAQRATFWTFLKVDCGYHRAGVDPEREDSVRLALRMHESPHVELKRMLTHAGHSYHGRTRDEVRVVADKDEGPTHVDPECGVGAVVSVGDGSWNEGMRVESLSREHGKLHAQEPIDFDAFPVGSKLRVVPNHSCLSAALFDRYHVVWGREVVEEWRPVRGW